MNVPVIQQIGFFTNLLPGKSMVINGSKNICFSVPPRRKNYKCFVVEGQ